MNYYALADLLLEYANQLRSNGEITDDGTGIHLVLEDAAQEIKKMHCQPAPMDAHGFHCAFLRINKSADIASMLGTEAFSDARRYPGLLDEFLDLDTADVHASAKPLHALLIAHEPNDAEDILKDDTTLVGVLLEVSTPVFKGLGYRWNHAYFNYVWGKTYNQAVHEGVKWAAEMRANSKTVGA
jgi:hypothetical protein